MSSNQSLDEYIHEIMQDSEKRLFLKLSGIIVDYGEYKSRWADDRWETTRQQIYLIAAPAGRGWPGDYPCGAHWAEHYFIEANDPLLNIMKYSGDQKAIAWINQQLEKGSNA